MSRYHRQMLLNEIGPVGQARLAEARVVLIGCGALGSVIAEQLGRSGIGHLTIADRDIVELSNLQRQVLFDEDDASSEIPKAIAASRRLQSINSDVTIVPALMDVHAGNVEALCEGAHLILDGTDNVQTRYLINDVAVKHNIPWIYGGCVGVEGRMMPVLPGEACLRCIFPDPPRAEQLPTCDTNGVLGPGASIIASLQSIAAIKLLTGHAATIQKQLHTYNFWTGQTRVIDIASARRSDCICCGQHQFAFLQEPTEDATTLCGRHAVQVRPAISGIDLKGIGSKLSAAGDVQETPYFLRCDLREPAGVRMTLFADGRAIFWGVTDLGRARSLYARYIGQ